MAEFKGLYLLASTASQSGTVIAWPTLLFSSSEFSKCDILINVSTFSAGTAHFNIAVQENFSDLGYLTTAQSGSQNAAGTYWLVHDFVPATTIPANIAMSSPLLGKGREKQIKTTFDGVITTFNANIYILPYQ